MAITALPTPPSRDDPTNFSARADAFLGALPDFATEANALAVDVNADAVSAAASEAAAELAAINAQASVTEAEAAASAASAAANATKWVSGTLYVEGDVVWSPINYLNYRRKATGAGTTDPSADGTNWAQATGDVTKTGTETLTNKTIQAANLTGATQFAGSSGTAGQVLTSAGAGNAPTWATPTGGGVGVVSYSSLTTTKQLVNTDMGSIILSASASGIVVKMPDATTLTSSQRTAFIKNTGSFTIYVFDYNSNPLFNLDPDASVTLFAVSVASQAGTWTSDSYIPASGITAGNAFTNLLYSVDVQVHEGIILRFNDGTNSVPGSVSPIELVREIDGVQTIIGSFKSASYSGGSGALLGACKTNNPGQVILYWKNDLSFINWMLCTIDANTLSYSEGSATNSGLAITSSNTPYWNFDCIVPSSGKPIYLFNDGTVLRMLSSTATPTTNNSMVDTWTDTSFGIVPTRFFQAAEVDTNKLIVSYASGTTTYVRAVDVASTPSLGTAVTVNTGQTLTSICKAGTNTALVFSGNSELNSSMYYSVVTVSGTTCTVQSNISGNGQFYGNAPQIVNVDPVNNAVFFSIHGDFATTGGGYRYMVARKITLSGTTVTVGSNVVVSNRNSLNTSNRLIPIAGRRAMVKGGMRQSFFIRESALT